MAGARRSNRVASSSSKPVYNEDVLEGKAPRSAKRKTASGSSPAAKRGKKAPEEKQQTLEESLDESKPAPPNNQDAELAEVIEKSKTEVSGPQGDHEEPEAQGNLQQESAMIDAPATKEELEEHEPAHAKPSEEVSVKPKEEPAKREGPQDATRTVEMGGGKDQPFTHSEASGETKASNEVAKPEMNGHTPSDSKKELPISKDTHGYTAVESHAPDHDTPSSILEKGILYFLFRGRVGIDDPQDVNDIARSFIVMRPLPHDAKIGDGPIGDAGNCRLIAVPKKTLPLSGKDRFLSFLEKSKVSFADLKNSFQASEYETKTAGTRHSPAMTPVGEAVYAITTTGRESHLAYILTIPDSMGEVQRSIGLKERGSFLLSTKNPQTPSPANANIGRSPDYPQEILDEFRSLRWMPTQPKHLDYVNTQLLLIGESGGLEKATEAQPKDEDKDTPLEEIEKLEGEDEIRVKHLNGDDAIFSDLNMSKKDLPKVLSTWD